VNRGACLWFTGLSGAGKTTTADALVPVLEQRGRTVTVLDGDVVRTHISKGLGFSRDDRDTQVKRVGFVSAEIVRHGGLVICSLVSPYRSTRNEVRAMVEALGGPGSFIEIFVDTPLAEAIRRDVKGWYAGAERGEVKNMTGVDDPYEPPDQAEVVLETVDRSVDDNVAQIVEYLEEHGVLS
jgi:sulfate adenylyltransferase